MEAHLTPTQVKNMIQFLRHINKLKHLYRTGWVNSAVSQPETVASHMWRMSIMSMMIPPCANVNREVCLKMCLVHDLAESMVGDITPFDGVAEEDKHQREVNAIEFLRKELLNGLELVSISNKEQNDVEGVATSEKAVLSKGNERDEEFATVVHEMLDLFMEYERNETPEARLVKDFDKFDMILQADEYERDQHMFLPSFFATTQSKFQTSIGQSLAQELYEQRNARLEQQPTAAEATTTTTATTEPKE